MPVEYDGRSTKGSSCKNEHDIGYNVEMQEATFNELSTTFFLNRFTQTENEISITTTHNGSTSLRETH